MRPSVAGQCAAVCGGLWVGRSPSGRIAKHSTISERIGFFPPQLNDGKPACDSRRAPSGDPEAPA